jgi:hypothetical protein
VGCWDARKMKAIAWIGIGSVVCGGAVFACSSDPEGEPLGGRSPGGGDAGFHRDGSVYDSQPSPESGLGELRFQPAMTYSGYDGTHTFIVPIAVYDAADDLEVTTTDPSAATVTPKKLRNPVNPDGIVDNGKYFFVTVKRAGTIALRAKSSGETAEATIEVADYAPGRWETGETRYTNASAGGDPPCTNCHVNGQAIDHSPASMAGASDPKLMTVITTGISTAGFPITVDPSDPSKQHKWEATEDELDGLVTYLRGLEPRGFE